MDFSSPKSSGNSIIIYSNKGSVIFSSNGKKIENRKAPRKHKMHKNIVNLHFEEMRKFNTNIFWDKILVKFSCNMFPKDFRYTNSTLYYKVKTKKHKDELFIDTEKVEETFYKLIEFLRSKGIIPITDVVDDYEQDYENTEKKELTSWKDVGRFKGVMIYEYIKLLGDKYKLNNKELKQIESLLKISLYNDIIKNENIIITDEKISKIIGLEWSEQKRIFSINKTELNAIKFTKTSNSVKEMESFYTISSYSDDQKVNFGSEVKVLDISKEWETFLRNTYC